MTKTSTKREDVSSKIRNKLIAAIAMLLISILLVVSSTYAWFTLSIAPEVKGIDTSITGNGSLEIALLPTDGSLAIPSGKASANQGGSIAVKTANTTWGNIVELNDGYGLDKIALLPALFDTTELTLKSANYGEDGRVTTVSDGTDTQLFSYGGSVFDGTDKGVRAIGRKIGEDDFDPYGYVIDLAMRVNTTADNGNAAKLLLQTTATDRVYNDSTSNPDTMGGGSTMTFTKTDADGGKLVDLMSAVRVTFVLNYGTAATNQYLVTAKLDTTDIAADATYATAPLYLYNGEGNKLDGSNAVILDSLTKNSATQISAVVWLDGSTLKNSAVGISETSLTGSLNLQFATDVTLYPANNAELKG